MCSPIRLSSGSRSTGTSAAGCSAPPSIGQKRASSGNRRWHFEQAFTLVSRRSTRCAGRRRPIPFGVCLRGLLRRLLFRRLGGGGRRLVPEDAVAIGALAELGARQQAVEQHRRPLPV